MANKRPYLERLLLAVQHLHNCDAVHVRSVPVTESFQGRVIWDGEVEVFTLRDHPKARTCYAWSRADGTHDEHEKFITVLELPPVDSPSAAVKVAIASEIWSKKLDKKSHSN
ncbi:MAG: hypothetical protein ACLQAH_05210 [Limisphaerales bacterium]